jgi:hypothetical protein
VPFVGFKIARVGLAKKIKNGGELEPYKPEKVQILGQKVDLIVDQDMGDENKTP